MMKNLRNVYALTILSVFITVNAATVNGSDCGCSRDFTDSKSFESYIWDEPAKKFIEVLVRDINGQAVFEGDVIVGTTAEMKELAKAIKSSSTAETLTPESLGQRFQDLIKGHRNSRNPWKDNIVPYSLNSYLMRTGRQYRRNERLRKQVEDAIKLWADGTGLTFKDVTSENSPSDRRMIRFQRSKDGTCSWNTKSGIADILGGCVRHEIGHALGLAHEHTRSDRDDFVTVNRENIDNDHCSQFKPSTLSSRHIGAYDFASIMHYSPDEFSCNRKLTLTTVPPNRINRTNTISAGDFQAVRELQGIERPNVVSRDSFIVPYGYYFQCFVAQTER